MIKKNKRNKSDEEATPPRFKVGDLVRFLSGDGEVEGIVVEDRGPLGIGGQRIYGLHFEFLPGETRYTERDEGELTPVGAPIGRERDVPAGKGTRPMAKKSKRNKIDDSESPPKFKVGDRVLFPRPCGKVEGVVVEDRGPLGVGGRRLYGLHYEFLPGETRYTERPEVDLTPAPAT
ncbi:MAG: hypothetical protein HYS12_15910 [Planctomycetes bacterium]|nr:hypothetical protein [Planctomycetota bacterium]